MPPAARPGGRTEGASRRNAAAGRGGGGKARAKTGVGPAPASRPVFWRRWIAVLICVAVLLIGVPLAHAMLGELGALLMLVGVGGFALGRATAPGTTNMLRRSSGRS
ncbi:hypothetical protein ACFOD4_14910 [Pseudoroseomonas globiformis]|uniref:Uncharacterized protein n=1 Tax=Teichococcus globiformis TaxID=2307229 RepID=A0ABV7G5A1_9PROT